MDSNHRKLTLADLQSAPFSHSGNYPSLFLNEKNHKKTKEPIAGLEPATY